MVNALPRVEIEVEEGRAKMAAALCVGSKKMRQPSAKKGCSWDFGLSYYQTVDFSTIFACASAPRNSWISRNMRLNAITLICILLLIGAVGKSAQIGSHTWSPDAMEGPTPVSALIHAATMVTAGVFMIARCSPLFEYPPTALIVITFAGATTSFLAATTGILQNDLKRVIAYSTCSQLGYMIFACGISNYSVSVFHLMNQE
ncbi:NADH-ubiquinone oxidoreductase chain 5-like [Actinidia eriantha]|uniref:NADH-ubiquinone oxidoreductase chain 5-like n=1 Tax=Actinidia eriantha TaxID=165200 RepID=UPI002587EFF4|nr:NADH-ubiquinone oxidoreductase chain 5-like [Actinidia eriantha]